jgi:hypothetical protein
MPLQTALSAEVHLTAIGGATESIAIAHIRCWDMNTDSFKNRKARVGAIIDPDEKKCI